MGGDQEFSFGEVTFELVGYPRDDIKQADRCKFGVHSGDLGRR